MTDTVKFHRINLVDRNYQLQDNDIPVNNKQSIGVRSTLIVRTFSLIELLKALWRVFK